MVGGGVLVRLPRLGIHVRNSASPGCWRSCFITAIALGALFLVMVHHLTDAGWSVGIRRFCEHIASLLFPWLAILFLPVLLLAPKIYHWMTLDRPPMN